MQARARKIFCLVMVICGVILVAVGLWYAIYKTQTYYEVYHRFDEEAIGEFFAKGLVILLCGIIAMTSGLSQLSYMKKKR